MSDFLVRASDATILLVIAGMLVAVALGVAELVHRFFFAGLGEEIEHHAKLLDLVHSSLLAFVAFMLAISVSDVRTNFGKTDDAVAREGMLVAAFAREIGEQPADWAEPTRDLLRRYVQTVATDEWRRLGAAEPSLSPQAQTLLDDLRAALRRLAANEDTRRSLFERHDRLELARIARYENATRSVPRVFWVLIGGFLLGGMVMNGRYRPTVLTRSLIAGHFAAIGLCIALIFILDEPFRGETSVAPTPLVDTLRRI